VSVPGRRRLSESISEGDGISILVELDGGGDADVDARALVAAPHAVPEASAVPVVARGDSPADAERAGADAWLLVVESQGDALVERYKEAVALGLECVVDVRDEEELERVLAELDPEILLLSTRDVEPDADAVDRVLELLPDVPAGKLAVAELLAPTDDDVRALERAGVDAVLVRR
jgi:hypothetical protein